LSAKPSRIGCVVGIFDLAMSNASWYAFWEFSTAAVCDLQWQKIRDDLQWQIRREWKKRENIVNISIGMCTYGNYIIWLGNTHRRSFWQVLFLVLVWNWNQCDQNLSSFAFSNKLFIWSENEFQISFNQFQNWFVTKFGISYRIRWTGLCLVFS